MQKMNQYLCHYIIEKARKVLHLQHLAGSRRFAGRKESKGLCQKRLQIRRAHGAAMVGDNRAVLADEDGAGNRSGDDHGRCRDPPGVQHKIILFPLCFKGAGGTIVR